MKTSVSMFELDGYTIDELIEYFQQLKKEFGGDTRGVYATDYGYYEGDPIVQELVFSKGE